MASRAFSKKLLSTALRTTTTPPTTGGWWLLTSSTRAYPRLPQQPNTARRRCFAHAIPKPRTSSSTTTTTTTTTDEDKKSTPTPTPTPRKLLEPHYRLVFTCVPCGARSSHVVSKQGYHGGSVLISCPECRNRHVIADNLNIFGDRKVNVEDLLREKGQLVKRGTLGVDGDVEFWQDDDETTQEEGAGRQVTSHSATAAPATTSGLGGGGDTNVRPSPVTVQNGGAAGHLQHSPSPSPSNTTTTTTTMTTPTPTPTPTPSTRRQFHASAQRLQARMEESGSSISSSSITSSGLYKGL
ncbi:DNL zinc finger-domain-containing protein [Xylariaceae sp. FL0594]|nr:DNL zinc finger-domain-containing protein [Xylariaceae sp. FL0594]